jgi:MYXO-CTERM domain-containing protein
MRGRIERVRLAHMVRQILGAAAALAVLAVGARVHAAEWWVDQAAAAGGDGTQAKPFQTLNDAKAVLTTGDTIWVMDGTYDETVDFWHVPAGAGTVTTVRAAAGAKPVIDGGGGDFVIQAGETPNMTFQGLTIRNGSTGFSIYQADGCQVIDCVTESTGGSVSFYFSSKGYVSGSKLEGSVSGKNSDGTVIEYNEIYGSGAEGITLHADSKNCRYSHNAVHDNTSVNIYLDSISNTLVDGNLVYMSDPGGGSTVGIMLADESYPNVTAPVLTDITVINNVVIHNESGIRFWDGSFPGQSALKNVVIANNTVVDNATSQIKWDAGPHQNTVVQNNIFAAQSGKGLLALQANSTIGVSLDHNLWYLPGIAAPFLWGSATYDAAGWASATGNGAGDVTVDPSFASAWDLPADNLSLAAGSPAIDSGIALAQVTTDYLGAARPAGSGYDLGAFEYGATPPTGGSGGGPPGTGGAATGGSTAGGSGGASAGTGGVPASGGSGANAAKAGASDDGGCGCRVPRPRGGSAPWALVALGLALLRRRGATLPA